MNNEGALIAFTLLSQLIVGSTILYSFIYFTGKENISLLPSGFNVKTPELLLLSGVILAVGISFLHLGKPLHAFNALNNLKSSWISREIFSLFLFSLSILLLFFGRRTKGTGEKVHSFLFLFSVFSGILLISVMIRLYMIPTIISWTTWLTPVSFALSTILLGTCGVLAYSFAGGSGIFKVKPLLLLLIVLMFVEGLISGLNYSMLDQISVSHENNFLLNDRHLHFTVIRIVLILSTLIVLVSAHNRVNNHASGYQMKFLVGLAVFLILLEQVTGRYMFYLSYVKAGL